MHTLWLFLSFTQLQLDLQPGLPQATSQADCTTENQPLVLLHRQNLTVHQANDVAQKLGIIPGQSLAHACALCASLQVLPWQPELEQQMLDMLTLDCYQLCADLAQAPPNALWLRLDPMLQLYGGLPFFMQQLTDTLQKHSVQFQYGGGVTAEAARLLCFYQPGHIVQSLSAQQLALQQCPITLTDLSPALIQQMQRLGIHQLGSLMSLSQTELSRRFNIELMHYLQRLQGQLPPLLHFYQPPEQFNASLELLYQLEHYPQLMAPLRHLLQRLQHFLQRRDQLCYQLELELTLRDKAALCLKLQSPQAEARAEAWLCLWQLKLEAIQLPAPVLGLSLRASQYCSRDQSCADLYAGKQGQYSPLQLVGLLQAKLGADQVRRPVEQPAFLPEIAGHSISLQQLNTEEPLSAARRVQQSTPAYLTAAPKVHRPAFLLPVPEPLQQQVRLLPGIERIQTQWWQGTPLARDYLTAQGADGRWLWLYRNEHQQWFVHGIFA